MEHYGTMKDSSLLLYPSMGYNNTFRKKESRTRTRFRLHKNITFPFTYIINNFLLITMFTFVKARVYKLLGSDGYVTKQALPMSIKKGIHFPKRLRHSLLKNKSCRKLFKVLYHSGKHIQTTEQDPVFNPVASMIKAF